MEVNTWGVCLILSFFHSHFRWQTQRKYYVFYHFPPYLLAVINCIAHCIANCDVSVGDKYLFRNSGPKNLSINLNCVLAQPVLVNLFEENLTDEYLLNGILKPPPPNPILYLALQWGLTYVCRRDYCNLGGIIFTSVIRLREKLLLIL